MSYLGYETQNFNNVYLTLCKTEIIKVVMTKDVEQLDAVLVTGTRVANIFVGDPTGAVTSIGRR